MPKSAKPKVPEKADDEEQSEAFIKAAKEAQTSENPEAFDKAFRAVAKSTKPVEGRPRRGGKRSSA